MKRRLVFLNILLLASVAGGVWVLRQRAQESAAHEQQVLSHKIPVAPPPAIAPVPQPAPVAATSYIDVAAKVLFAKDRSPNPIVDPPKPVPEKKMPPLPFAYGVMDFGSGPTVIMAEKSGVPHHGFHIGEKVGEFTLAAVSGRELTLEWDGKEIKTKLEELEDKYAAVTAQVAAVTPAGAAAAPPPPKEPELPPDPRPGKDTGGGFKACRPGDNAPNGTVADGYRKVITVSPFGQHCTWEALKTN
jgi:hypothetical protein